MFSGFPRVHADDDREESRIKRGFEVAPVPLNLTRKNRELAGLGSYLVNAANDFNFGHTGGGKSGSLFPQRESGIDSGCSPCRNGSRQHCGSQQDGRKDHERNSVVGRHPEE